MFFFPSFSTFPDSHVFLYISHTYLLSNLAPEQLTWPGSVSRTHGRAGSIRARWVSTEAADTSACLVSPANWACNIYFLAATQSGPGRWQWSSALVITRMFSPHLKSKQKEDEEEFIFAQKGRQLAWNKSKRSLKKNVGSRFSISVLFNNSFVVRSQCI